jgi:hypothetical protein
MTIQNIMDPRFPDADLTNTTVRAEFKFYTFTPKDGGKDKCETTPCHMTPRQTRTDKGHPR